MEPYANFPVPPEGVTRASDVHPRAIEWLWFPFVPLGKLTLIAGKPGQGKSLSTVWLTAQVTLGVGIHTGPGSAIVLSAEDDPEDTIRPRLEAAGADLERCWIVDGAEIDVAQLDQLADTAGDAKLITIDPVTAFLPANVNAWKTQDIRRYLEPLRVFAAERRIAIVLVQHLNRRSDSSDALDRIADSAGLPQLCRSVLVWGPDPSDPEGDHGSRKVLARSKANLAKSSASATFTIEEFSVSGGINAPALTRGEDRRVDAEDVIVNVEMRTAQDEAVEWLRTQLADGPLSAKDVRKRAREDGIADRTLDRAKRTAGVVSKPDRSDAGITSWQWEIATPTTSYTDGDVGVLGDIGVVGKVAKVANNANLANNNGRAPLSALTADIEEER